MLCCSSFSGPLQEQRRSNQTIEKKPFGQGASQVQRDNGGECDDRSEKNLITLQGDEEDDDDVDNTNSSLAKRRRYNRNVNLRKSSGSKYYV
ncbi:hypothetical protein BHM03_00042248 [Ensete ventricosum]|nr:hypothetical protein BHM03_00042248 [Ensete ventricosum]